MVIISRYILKYKKDVNRYKVISYDDKQCPICGGSLRVIGSRDRKYTNESGEGSVLVVRRLICDSCHKIHHELPDAIFPYHRLCSKTIELIVEGDRFNAVCDNASYDRVRVWWSKFSLATGVLSIEDTFDKINEGAIFYTDFLKVQ